ncbi:MAG: hypothetical protein JO362_17585 [Streptomycetaceae bacterium]|nr:hypothetical protein [Streptomycetaceae bacterium]
MYVTAGWHQPANGETPSVWDTVGVNYKKRGACPNLDPNTFKAATGISLNSVQPVPKVICEDLPGQIGANPYGSGDMCTHMDMDAVYVWTWDSAAKRLVRSEECTSARDWQAWHGGKPTCK